MKKIRKGDEVVVITGKSRGLRGHILQIKGDKVLVSGANKVIKHEKPNPQYGIEGGQLEKEAMMHISNVMLYNSESDKGDRVKIEVTEITNEDGSKTTVRERLFKSTNKKVG